MNLRLMLDRFMADGMQPNGKDVEEITDRLGRPLGSYEDFARETLTAGKT